FSSRRRHTRWPRDWSSDVCSSDLARAGAVERPHVHRLGREEAGGETPVRGAEPGGPGGDRELGGREDQRGRELGTPRIPRQRHEIGRASCRERGEERGGGE